MVLRKLYIESTGKTPYVDFNQLTGEFIIHGKSIPENAALLYEGVLNWIDEYIKSPKPINNLRINLEYFNTASAIWLAKIIRSLSSINDKEVTLIIHLYFTIEDYDSMDTEDLQDELHPLLYLIGKTVISLGFKIYGTDSNGEVIKESIILI